MISMTGYAWREWADEDVSLSVEIKGYNNRFLEIYVNLPAWLSYLEPKVRELAIGLCVRGKVELIIRLKEINSPLSVTINASAAAAYMKAISGITSELGLDPQLSVSTLLGLEGVLDIERKRDEQRHWSIIEPVLMEAIGVFQAEREREGKYTEENILNEISKIEMALQTVKMYIPNLENTIKENIRSRFKELIGDCGSAPGSVQEIAVDEHRILAETAMLLMKYTISEEISRLSSHLAEFRAETAKNPHPGKKLDFLCQEINREINTIGSKSTIVEVSSAVVNMKEALENVREQLRNVE